jgi:hypothetical protein
MILPKALTGLVIIFLVQGCAKMDNGADWALADFNKYDRNYAPFPTDKIIIGGDFNDAVKEIGSKYSVVEESSLYRIIAFQQWASVLGPDYVQKTLYMEVSSGKVVSWKITNDTTSIVPRSW